jgi:hypothetical protein
LISDLLNSISQIHQNQIQVYQILISNLGSKIDSINGFQFKISRFLIPEFCLWTRFKFLIFIQKPPKRKPHLKKPILFFKMGPVNFRNSNYSSSARLTVKNTILDRAFTRLSKFQLPDLELKFSISRQLPDSEFLFLRRDNSYFQFHRMPILMRYPITVSISVVADDRKQLSLIHCCTPFSFFRVLG